VTKPKPETTEDIPCNYESVTAKWFEAVLCKNVPDAKVLSVRPGRGSKGTSSRRQFLLEYNEAGRSAGLPASVFAKGTPDLMTRLAGTVTESMTGEANFYKYVRPDLDIEAPLGYHSAYDLRRGRSIHLIEDLVETKNATFCNPQTPISRKQAEEVVHLLGTLHGTYYKSPRLNTDFAHLLTWVQEHSRMITTVNLNKYHHRGFEKAVPVIPEELLRRRNEIWPAIIKSTGLHDQLPHTIIHCDVHLGNWYMTGEGKMGLLDWQCIAKGHWSRDVAYAITATLPIEDRRAWERKLIELYLNRFEELSGEKIPFDEAWLRYRQQVFGALIMWTPTYSPPAFVPNDMQPEEVSVEMIRRFSQAIVDLESLESLQER
jgi:thiamine kinase-like enzyme